MWPWKKEDDSLAVTDEELIASVTAKDHFIKEWKPVAITGGIALTALAIGILIPSPVNFGANEIETKNIQQFTEFPTVNEGITFQDITLPEGWTESDISTSSGSIVTQKQNPKELIYKDSVCSYTRTIDFAGKHLSGSKDNFITYEQAAIHVNKTNVEPATIKTNKGNVEALKITFPQTDTTTTINYARGFDTLIPIPDSILINDKGAAEFEQGLPIIKLSFNCKNGEYTDADLDAMVKATIVDLETSYKVMRDNLPKETPENEEK